MSGFAFLVIIELIVIDLGLIADAQKLEEKDNDDAQQKDHDFGLNWGGSFILGVWPFRNRMEIPISHFKFNVC